MLLNNDNDNDNDTHNNYQRRTPDGGGWINMKNKIDHCSGSCCPFEMKIGVSKSPCGPRSLGSSLRAAAWQVVKNKHPGHDQGAREREGDVGEGEREKERGEAELEGRHKNVTDRPEAKTVGSFV